MINDDIIAIKNNVGVLRSFSLPRFRRRVPLTVRFHFLTLSQLIAALSGCSGTGLEVLKAWLSDNPLSCRFSMGINRPRAFYFCPPY